MKAGRWSIKAAPRIEVRANRVAACSGTALLATGVGLALGLSACSPAGIFSDGKGTYGSYVEGSASSISAFLASDPPDGLFENLAERLLFPSSYAGLCKASDVAVSIYALDSSGTRGAQALTTTFLKDAKGTFRFDDTGSVGVAVKSSSIDYLLVSSGCVDGLSLSRPLTSYRNQNINSGSALVGTILNLSPSESRMLANANGSKVSDFIDRITAKIGDGYSISTTYAAFANQSDLVTEFKTLFGFAPSLLELGRPTIKLISAPTTTTELVPTRYSVSASHWNPNYSIAMLWKLDGKIVSTASAYTYTPSNKAQGSHEITLYVGRDSGGGSIDLTAPYYTQTIPLEVIDLPPVSVSLSTVELSSANIRVGSTATVTVTIKDTAGVQVANAGLAANLSAAMSYSGTSDGTIGNFTPVAGNPGRYQATFTATQGGSASTFRVYLSGFGVLSTQPGFTVLTNQFVLSGPTGVVTGSCAGPYTVAYKDSNGSAVVASTQMSAALSGYGSGRVYSDASCATPVDQVSIASGASSASFYYKSYVAQTIGMKAGFLNLVDSGTLTITIAATAPIVLKLAGASTLTAGTCSSVYSVTTYDAYGNILPVSSASTVSLSTGSAGVFYSDSACTTPITTLSFAAGDYLKNFYFKNSLVQNTSLSAAGAGLATGVFPLTVTGLSPTRLLLTGPSTSEAGSTACGGPFTVTTVDSMGNASRVPSQLTVTLAGKGQGNFYKDSACSVSATPQAVASGTATYSFYFRDNYAESLIFSVTASGYATAVLPVTTTTTGTNNRLVMSGLQTPTVSPTCTLYTVTNYNGSGVANVGGSGITVTIGGKGTGTLWTNSGCSTTLTSSQFTIASGASSGTFYLKDTASETLTLTATTATAGFASASYTVRVGASTPLKLGITAPGSAPTAGTCSGAYTVYSQDAGGAAVATTGATAVTLTGGGSATFYSDASCSTAVTSINMASGATSQAFYLKDAVAETVQIQASATGYTSGAITATVGAGSAAKLALSGPLQVTKGLCSPPMTVTARDSQGNAVTLGSAVTVDLTAAAGTFYSDSNCSASIVSKVIASGASSATFYYKHSSAGAMAAVAADHTSVLSSDTFNFFLRSPVTWVSAGSAHTCAVIGGGVECWGYNLYGQLGNGTTTSSTVPVQVLGLESGVATVEAGTAYVCALLLSGAVKCWGSNGLGQLGVPGVGSSTVPVQVTGLSSGVTSIAVGTSGACALLSDQSIKCWGSNATGQLGIGSSQDSFIPVQVQGFGPGSGVTAIFGGNSQFYALKGDAVYAWGQGAGLRLGDGTTDNHYTPIAHPNLGSGSGLQFLARGSRNAHTCGWTGSALKCWGSGTFGELGSGSVASATPVTHPTITSGVTALSVGDQHTCAVISGSVQCWGISSTGQLGNGYNAVSGTPVQVQGITSGATAVTSGYRHSCAIVYGQVQCWGDNSSGQLGVGTLQQSNQPVTITGLETGATSVALGYNSGYTALGSNACAVVNGGAKCWGDNTYGQLGNGTSTESGIPVDVTGLGSGSGVTQLTLASGISTCALVNGGVQCWGNGGSGQLGNNSGVNTSTPVAVSGLSSGVISIGSGSIHFCALRSNGEVWCWGGASNGQLGDGGNSNRFAPVKAQLPGVASALAVGRYDTCALVSGGVWCWGGSASALNVANSNVTVPQPVIGLESGVTFLSNSTGPKCVIQNGVSKCWGANVYGQLGNNSTVNSYTPVAVSGLPVNGVQSIQGGAEFACALLNDSSMRCWGNNSLGALAVSSTVMSLVPLTPPGLSSGISSFATAQGGSNGCAITTGGAVQCWGGNQLTNASHLIYSVVPLNSLTFDPTAPSTTLTDSVGVPHHLVFGGATNHASTCSTALNISLADVYSNTATYASNLSVDLLGAGVGAFYSDSACTSAISSVTIAAGSSVSANFYFKANSRDPVTVAASASPALTGLARVSKDLTFSVAVIGNLTMTGSSSVLAGSCSGAYTISSFDLSGNVLPMDDDTVITLNGMSNAGAYYSDATCSAPVTSVTLRSGESSMPVYIKSPYLDNLLLYATTPALTTGKIPVTLTAGSVAKLAVTGPASVVVGTCSPVYTASTVDSGGRVAELASGLTVNLSGAGQGAFYSDATCSSQITSLSFASGAHAGTFYFKSSIAQNLSIGVSAAGLTPITSTLSVLPGPPTRLLIAGPATPEAGACSSAYTIKSVDAWGNLSKVAAATTITLGGKGQGSFYSNATCANSATTVSFLAGANTGTFYLKNLYIESLIVTGTATGLGVGILPVTTVATGSNMKLVFSGVQTPTVSPTCTLYTVTNYNSSGAVANVGGSGITVTIGGKGTGTLWTNSGCSTTLTSNQFTIASNASSGTFYMKDTASETLTLTATPSVTGFAYGYYTVRVGASTAVKLAITPPGAAPVVGACSGPYTVTSQDAAGSAAAVSSATAVALSGGAATLYSDACTTPATSITINASTQTFYLKGTVAESFSLQASATGFISAQQAVTISPSSVTRFELGGPTQVPAGTCSSAFTVTAKDANANTTTVAGATSVSLATTAGTFYSDSGCSASVSSVTVAAGTSSKSFYFKHANREDVKFDATSAGLASDSLRVSLVYPAAQVSAGAAVTCAVVSGSVKCWGTPPQSAVGLGDGTTSAFAVPVQVAQLLSGATQVSVGLDHSCAIVNGGAWCWGMGSSGNLGDGTTGFSLVPIPVIGLSSGVTQISAGAAYTCAVVNGAAKCWGKNSSGQLGNNSVTDSSVPVQVSGLTSGVTAISTGNGFACAVVSGGLWCWGSNANGQVGDGTKLTRYVPVQVFAAGSGVSGVAGGSSNTCALVGDGLMCWGDGTTGANGDGGTSTSDVVTPTAVIGLGAGSGVTQIASGMASLSMCAIANGAAYCWGKNNSGQLGNQAADLGRYSTPAVVYGLSSGVTNITTGGRSNVGYQSCAVRNGEILCWGSNGWGQLGNGQSPGGSSPVQVVGLPAGSGVTDVRAGGETTCAVVNGGVQCWGDNSDGTIGDGTNTSSAVPVQVSGIPSGSAVTALNAVYAGAICAVFGDAAKCWGLNSSGDLGDGTLVSRNSPVSPYGLGTGAGVVGVSHGYRHGCALLSDGSIRCWGANGVGNLGDGTTLTRTIPVQVQGLPGPASAVFAGVDMTCAIVSGSLWCWGRNDFGQLGIGTTVSSLLPVQVTTLGNTVSTVAISNVGACALKTDGSMWCWGANMNGRLGDPAATQYNLPNQVVGLSSGVTAIAMGGTHTCAVVSGAAKCWGLNSRGQLGIPSTQQQYWSTPMQVDGLTSGVTKISAGFFHTCAVVSGGLKCWGLNSFGELGNGYNSDSFSTGVPTPTLPIQ